MKSGRRLRYLILFTILLSSAHSHNFNPIQSSLLPNVLLPGATNTYALKINPGDYVLVSVQHSGTDVRLKVIDPAGKDMAISDRWQGARGSESVSFLAASDGIHTLRVINTNPVLSGQFDIVITEPRPATAADRRHIEAERAFNEALALRYSDTVESLKAAKDNLEQALLVWCTEGNKEWEAITLYTLG